MDTIFVDGTAVTKGCQCDKDGKLCEFPCWQRIGLTADPCCEGCAPLPSVEDDRA